jgi:hypothetical protein
MWPSRKPTDGAISILQRFARKNQTAVQARVLEQCARIAASQIVCDDCVFRLR